MARVTIASVPNDLLITIKWGKHRTTSVMKSNYLFLPVQFEFGIASFPSQFGLAMLIRWHDLETQPWIMENVAAEDGWGPLIYDLSMEFATLNGGGLTSCGRSTNPQARAVWKYYFQNR